jgi:broad specificity phosphatase PhoE
MTEAGEMDTPQRKNVPVTRILIARHGQTVSNREGRFCGHSETELTPLGEAQAKALAARLSETAIHAAYTSDFSRAIRTAGFALEGRNLALGTDPALRELHYGEWEMERESAIRKSHPEQHKLMRDESPEWRPPGGENVAIVRERMQASIQRLIRRHKGETVLVVSHGTAIACLLSEFLGMPIANTFRFDIGNCALSEITVIRGHPFLSLLNDRSHLVGVTA